MSANPVIEDQSGAAQAISWPGILLRSLSFPVILRPPRPLSDEELLEFCAANNPLRIERNPAGELVLMTPAGGKTSNSEGYLFRELDLWVEQQGRGVAFNSNGGFSLPDSSVRAADAAWLSSQKWDSLTREQKSKFVPFCPEFVIELRSPSDSVSELESKMRDWIANGAELAWLIDPERKLALIFRPGRAPETLQQPQQLFGEGPVQGFVLKMQRIWE